MVVVSAACTCVSSTDVESPVFVTDFFYGITTEKKIATN